MNRTLAVVGAALILVSCGADRAGTVKATGSPQKTSTTLAATTTTTILPSTTLEVATTLASTTTVDTTPGTCDAPPAALAPPTLVPSGDRVAMSSLGTWDFGPHCTDQGMSIHWERSFLNGAYEPFGGLADTWEPLGCLYRYKVTVRRANEFGVTASASDVVGPFC